MGEDKVLLNSYLSNRYKVLDDYLFTVSYTVYHRP